ncbi:hypothetical protein PFISCL1PPCAC_17023, partial [Pristionchus fissidentatus]
DLSAPCTNENYSWYIEKSGEWYMATNNVLKFSMNIYCQYALNTNRESDDFCSGFAEDTENYTCYQASSARANSTQAQRVCKSLGGTLPAVHNAKENAFIRRLAISNGQFNGVMLGGMVSPALNNFQWADGSVW